MQCRLVAVQLEAAAVVDTTSNQGAVATCHCNLMSSKRPLRSKARQIRLLADQVEAAADKTSNQSAAASLHCNQRGL